MKLRIACLVTLLILLSGCASNTLKKEAFAKPKTLALVTVSGSVHGLATNDQDDKQLLKNVVDVTFKELNKSSHLKLVPQSTVFASKQYKAIKDQGPMMMSDLAEGYKRFDPKSETAALKALAKEIRVDGFVIVVAGYGTAKSGMSVGLGGVPIPLSAGSTKAQTTYILSAFDANGEVFWSESVELKSDDGVTTVMGVGNIQSLQSNLVGMTQAASREAVARLDKKLSGRE